MSKRKRTSQKKKRQTRQQRSKKRRREAEQKLTIARELEDDEIRINPFADAVTNWTTGNPNLTCCILDYIAYEEQLVEIPRVFWLPEWSQESLIDPKDDEKRVEHLTTGCRSERIRCTNCMRVLCMSACLGHGAFCCDYCHDVDNCSYCQRYLLPAASLRERMYSCKDKLSHLRYCCIDGECADSARKDKVILCEKDAIARRKLLLAARFSEEPSERSETETEEESQGSNEDL